MTTYTSTALTGSNITALKQGWRKTGWRLRLLKASGEKMPDSTTTNILKIDPSYLGNYSVNTATGHYKKMIHDPDQNRTFILHHKAMDDTDAVVSIINHFLDESDDDFVEEIKSANCDGWDTDYPNTAYDMDYDHHRQELAISTTGNAAASKTPALFIINCVKYAEELVSNICNELQDNDDYLNCTVFSAASNIHTASGNSHHDFVARYNGYWYTWTVNYYSTNEYYWHCGKFDNAGTYTLLFQWGEAPTSSDYAESVRYPTQPRTTINTTAVGGDLYLGDSITMFREVDLFRITDDGYLLIGNSPHDDANARHTSTFGVEPCISVINLSEMEAQTQSTYDSDTIIASGTITEVAQVNDSGKYEVSGELQIDNADISSVKGYFGIYISPNHSGSMAGEMAINTVYIEGSYGTTQHSGTETESGGNGLFQPGNYYHASMFAYEDSSITIGVRFQAIEKSTAYTCRANYVIKAWPHGTVDTIGAHNADAIIRPDGDTDAPATGDYTIDGHTLQYAEDQSDTEYLSTIDAIYDPTEQKFFCSFEDSGGTDAGLWVDSISQATKSLTKLTQSNSDLGYDYVGAFIDIDRWIGLISSSGTNAKVQFLKKIDNSFHETEFAATSLLSSNPVNDLLYDADHNYVGLCVGPYNTSEVWIWKPETVEGEWSRDPRVWWDGSNPDVTIGPGGTLTADDMGQEAHFTSPSFSESKSMGSIEFSFSVSGAVYLPWWDSPFNKSPDFEGNLNPTLSDSTRVILQTGVYNASGAWTWIDEAYGFIMDAPSAARAGAAEMTVSCIGTIGMFATYAEYNGVHKPDTTSYGYTTPVTLTGDADGLVYHYETGGSTVTDWAPTPQPRIYIDDTETSAYTLDTTNGTITFGEDKSGSTITATFDAYDSGTNEAEDIIYCILTYPNDLGGAGLDETYITDNILGETLTTADYLTYSFSKNNIRSGDDYNTIYRDGVEASVGAGANDYTWNYSDGSVTFNSDQSGVTITGDCTYYTIQKSGATLRTMYFNPRKQKSAYDAIQEVCRRVAPNYIMRERRDGKIEVDFFTQAAAGSEDFEITDSDIVITDLSANSAYENLATRVISFGKADLSELPNYCLGKNTSDGTLVDEWSSQAASYGWTHGWHASSDVDSVCDGEAHTGATTGYGGWGDGTYTVVTDLNAAGEDGIPVVSIDLESEKEIATIIVARSSQNAGEGQRADNHIVRFSVWVSKSYGSWTRIVESFEIGPGQNQRFVAGTNYDEGTTFRWVQIRCHALGIYTGPDGDADSQMNLGEVQCYESEIIKGVAVLQAEDSAEDLYDSTGLLDKYGYRTYIARGGQPDSALYTQSKANADAAAVLDEIRRLLTKIEIRSPWLPGIPIYNTIKVTNGALGKTATFFVESRTAGENGHTLTGSTLP